MNDISGAGWQVMFGSCLDRLPELADNSIDAVVTDPPYELGFMGKKWDSSGIAFDSAVWRECLRVLKPGGHLLAFGGSRTWHRIAVAIEDAGFEVRDSIAWLYGSGFPKSLDVSKAIDKSDAAEMRHRRNIEFTAWMRSTGITARRIDELTGTNMGGHYLTEASQPAVATADIFDKLRPYLPNVPEYIERLVAERTVESENYKQREVIGQKVTGAAMTAKTTDFSSTNFGSGQNLVDVTVPATAEAKKWTGWGTALKPAFEPVVVARKPLIGTVAENVLAYGTGGLNIDGTRIGSDGGGTNCANRDLSGNCRGHENANRSLMTATRHAQNSVSGRWPSNVMLDEYTAALLDEQSGVSKSQGGSNSNTSIWGGGNNRGEKVHFGDVGGASRFFYVAKASKRDRNEGLDGLEAQRHSDIEKADGVGGDNTRNRTNQARQNFHPTVKPTDLMRQLVRLVTPPGGVVLDPFTGSGSTGKAAILEGFKFVGVELTEDYLPIIEGRLSHAVDTVSERGKADDEKLF